ncbi:uncharacterized protein EV154DRAFT_188081 [Mucor mucedo]|uniref:uncharacterized protein n=1 Tax=Mucor mucedo TaxID=29922 RepID=UPI00221EAF27|nr:uncharacterized protein EV154DRAFT_188081 [Mucor mucedo]KAI7864014.1 hypothetical protein EV154DRAFT_188081 [Mucor mucedo]
MFVFFLFPSRVLHRVTHAHAIIFPFFIDTRTHSRSQRQRAVFQIKGRRSFFFFFYTEASNAKLKYGKTKAFALNGKPSEFWQ